MKFTIHVRTPEGLPGKLIYCNETNEVSYLDGTPVQLPDKSHHWDTAPVISPETPGAKSRQVQNLKIQMGLQCNYSCSYCSQATHLEHGEAVVTNVDDARDFLANLDSWLEGAPGNIQLWGGEPFVYWKAMRVLVPALREKYPDAQIGVITNGSLLDDEKLAWLQEYDMSVSISHDGPGQHLRGPDPLDTPETLAIWQRYVDVLAPKGRLSINSVLTADNCDVLAIRQWFVDRLGEEVPTNFEGVVNIHDEVTRGSSGQFTPEQYEAMKRSVYLALFSPEFEAHSMLGKRAVKFARALIERQPASSLGQKCSMDRADSLAVDLKGNALTCHNTGANSKHKIGHVGDFDNIKLDTSWHWSKREYCPSCPVLQICQGACMYIEGDDFAVTCQNEFEYAVPVFAAVLYDMFGVVFEAFEGEIKRPKLKKVIPIMAVGG